MSTIIATTLSNGSVSVPTATVVNGSAKAWVNLNGTGTIAARDSFNISSLTDNGTGNYTVNWTNDFSAADYAVSDATGSAAAANVIIIGTASGIAPTVGALRVGVNNGNTGASFDATYVFLSAHGDLA